MKQVLFLSLLLSGSLLANPITADVFTLEKTACFGTCPAYEVSVFADGTMIFNGKAYTVSEGIYRRPGDPELFQNIMQLLDDSHFQSFRDNYGWNEAGEDSPCKEEWTDHPSTQLSLQFAGTRKTVFHYHGCKGFDREDELEALEKALVELLDLKSYVGK